MSIRGTGTVQPTTDNVLSNAVIGYRNQAYQLQTSVFPIISTSKRKGSYWLFGKEAFSDEAELVGSTGESPRLTRSLIEGTFTLKPYGAAVENSWDVEDEASPIITSELKSAEYVASKIMLKLERTIGTAITTTGNWTSTAAIAAGSEWNTEGGGDPMSVIETAGLAIYDLIGIPIDEMTLVLPFKVARVLRIHEQLRDYLKFTNGVAPSLVTELMMAEIFGVKKVIVSKAQYNTAKKGLTVALSGMMSDSAFMCYATDSPALMLPNCGYSLELTNEKIIRTYQEPANRRDVIDGVKHMGVEVSAADAGYVITNCLA